MCLTLQGCLPAAMVYVSEQAWMLCIIGARRSKSELWNDLVLNFLTDPLHSEGDSSRRSEEFPAAAASILLPAPHPPPAPSPAGAAASCTAIPKAGSYPVLPPAQDKLSMHGVAPGLACYTCRLCMLLRVLHQQARMCDAAHNTLDACHESSAVSACAAPILC